MHLTGIIAVLSLLSLLSFSIAVATLFRRLGGFSSASFLKMPRIV